MGRQSIANDSLTSSWNLTMQQYYLAAHPTHVVWNSAQLLCVMLSFLSEQKILEASTDNDENVVEMAVPRKHK